MTRLAARRAPDVAVPSLASDEPRAIWRLFALFTLQDAMLFAYLSIAGILVWRAEGGKAQAECAQLIFICLAVLLLGCLWARTPKAIPAGAKWVLYRVVLVGILIDTYMMLRDLLPLVRPDSVDAALLRIDEALLGVTPAIWLERFNRLPIIEYFAFFYFSYFIICLLYVIAVVWLSKGGTQTTEFAIGTLVVFCLGQLGYMSVPAVGPIRYLTASFHGPVNGGFFWSCVTHAVEAGSAMKDVFPSLHTAVPTWLTLFAFRRARFDRRWLIPSRVTGFFAANIVISTMMLRWHYAIDVVAGLALATLAATLAPRLARLEEVWRERHGLPLPWSFTD